VFEAAEAKLSACAVLVETSENEVDIAAAAKLVQHDLLRYKAAAMGAS
jgi:predicted ATP-grasp superfamily ATP-dependent carboligase